MTKREADSNALSESERDAILRSVIGSQALAGIEISRVRAEELLDEIMNEPMITIEL
jgi:hypothetical protein